jgi:hypothetical protein
MNELLDKLKDLTKALDAGSYNSAPGQLVQGGALQHEDLSEVMTTVTYGDETIKLQKAFPSRSVKSTFPQYGRVIAYGDGFTGFAQYEGQVGRPQTGNYVRDNVAMCFFSQLRQVTDVANIVATIDGKTAEDREAEAAAKHMAGIIERQAFLGSANFSNAGVFDGNPMTTWTGPNMQGLDIQVRQSDYKNKTRDQMFAEFGSDESIVIPGSGTLTEEMIDDGMLRAANNFGTTENILTSTNVLNSYNKSFLSIQRNVLAGSPQGLSGGDYKKHATIFGTAKLDISHFLRGKYKPEGFVGSIGAASISGSSVTDSSNVTLFESGDVLNYYVTSANEGGGESAPSNRVAVTVAADGDKTTLTITHPGSGIVRYFNVYRTLVGGKAGTEKFIGHVKAAEGASSTTFTDLGNKLPAFSAAYFIEKGCGEFLELLPYSRVKMARTQLMETEAHVRYVTMAVTEPRKLPIIDNLV